MYRYLVAVLSLLFGVSQAQAVSMNYDYQGADLNLVYAQDPSIPSNLTYSGLSWGFTYDESFLGVDRANTQLSLSMESYWSLSIDNGSQSLSMTSHNGGFSSVPDPNDPYWIMESLNPVIGGMSYMNWSNVQAGSLKLQFDALGRLEWAEATYAQSGDFFWFSRYDRSGPDYQYLIGNGGIISSSDYELEATADGVASWLAAEQGLIATPLPASIGLLGGAFGLLGAVGWAGRRRAAA